VFCPSEELGYDAVQGSQQGYCVTAHLDDWTRSRHQIQRWWSIRRLHPITDARD